MGPYTKQVGSTAEIDDCWLIGDRDDQIIAVLDTELLADAVLAYLLGMTGAPSNFPRDTPISSSVGYRPYHCQSCGWAGTEDETWPSDGNPAPHVCPECGRTDLFPKE